MFQGPELEEIDVSNWDLSETETLNELFMNATFKKIT
jgi:surface protein